jgi:DNA invertase Pin-like site-specific DNA recombinase
MHNPLQNAKIPVVIGYARVSTDGQSVADQIAALKAAGAARVYSEKASGAKIDRPALARTIKSLGGGDTLLVCRLDRLARSTRDLLNTLHTVGEARRQLPVAR